MTICLQNARKLSFVLHGLHETQYEIRRKQTETRVEHPTLRNDKRSTESAGALTDNRIVKTGGRSKWRDGCRVESDRRRNRGGLLNRKTDDNDNGFSIARGGWLPLRSVQSNDFTMLERVGTRTQWAVDRLCQR